MPPECVGRCVVPWIEDIVHVQDGDLSAATVLSELRVIDGTVVIDHIHSATILTHDQIGRITE